MTKPALPEFGPFMRALIVRTGDERAIVQRYCDIAVKAAVSQLGAGHLLEADLVEDRIEIFDIKMSDAEEELLYPLLGEPGSEKLSSSVAASLCKELGKDFPDLTFLPDFVPQHMRSPMVGQYSESAELKEMDRKLWVICGCEDVESAKRALGGEHLHKIWAKTNAVWSMLSLANRRADRKIVTQLCCDAVRFVLPASASEDSASALAAIEAAERWAAGKGSLDAVKTAAIGAQEKANEFRAVRPPGSTAELITSAAAFAAACALGQRTDVLSNTGVLTADNVGQMLRSLVAENFFRVWALLNPGKDCYGDPAAVLALEKAEYSAFAQLASFLRAKIPVPEIHLLIFPE